MNFNLTSLFSLTIVLSVLLSGLHAKELPTLRANEAVRQAGVGVKKAVKDDPGSSSLVKVSGEVHPHVDKQTLKSALKAFSDQNMKADARHLKRQRHHARRIVTKRRLSGVLDILNSRAAALLGVTSA